MPVQHVDADPAAFDTSRQALIKPYRLHSDLKLAVYYEGLAQHPDQRALSPSHVDKLVQNFKSAGVLRHSNAILLVCRDQASTRSCEAELAEILQNDDGICALRGVERFLCVGGQHRLAADVKVTEESNMRWWSVEIYSASEFINFGS